MSSSVGGFSVVLICPIYNEENSIANIVQSLNRQSDLDFTVIFVDSGSTDASLEILRASENLFSRELVQFSDNLGICGNWARAAKVGLRNLAATHLGFLAADDMIDAHYVRRMKLAIAHDSNKVFTPTIMAPNSDKPIVLESFAGARAGQLIMRWSLVLMVFSLFERTFFETKVVKVLESTKSAAFDWWVARAAITSRSIRQVTDAIYFKIERGFSHSSSYYLIPSDPTLFEVDIVSRKRALGSLFGYPMECAQRAFEALRPIKNPLQLLGRLGAIAYPLIFAYLAIGLDFLRSRAGRKIPDSVN